MTEEESRESGSEPNGVKQTTGAGKTGNVAAPIYMAALVLMALGLNYGMIFIWPSEDKSLTYLPRFLTSVVLAFLLLHVMGLRQKT